MRLWEPGWTYRRDSKVRHVIVYEQPLVDHVIGRVTFRVWMVVTKLCPWLLPRGHDHHRRLDFEVWATYHRPRHRRTDVRYIPLDDDE